MRIQPSRTIEGDARGIGDRKSEKIYLLASILLQRTWRGTPATGKFKQQDNQVFNGVKGDEGASKRPAGKGGKKVAGERPGS